MNTQDLIDKITKAITYKFNSDPTTPGLQIASLRKSHGFYVSIVRYGKPFGKDKSVVCKAQSIVLDDALKDVATKLLSLEPISLNPLEQLNSLVNSK